MWEVYLVPARVLGQVEQALVLEQVLEQAQEPARERVQVQVPEQLHAVHVVALVPRYQWDGHYCQARGSMVLLLAISIV